MPQKGLRLIYSNKLLSAAISELGLSVCGAAELVGISPEEMYRALNFRQPPVRRNIEHNEALKSRLQTFTGRLWEELFPDPSYHAQRWLLSEVKRKQARIAPELKAAIQERNLAPQDPRSPLEEIIEQEETPNHLFTRLREVLASLTDYQRQVLEMRFFEKRTLEETGKAFGVTRDRIRQVEAKALRLMRHPTRMRALESL